MLAARDASAGPVVVTPLVSMPVQVQPGQLLALPLRVTNPEARAVSVTSRLALPTGWRIITMEGSLTLAAHESDVHLVSLAVPSEAAPGVYELTYTASDADSSQPAGSTIIRVFVGAMYRIGLQMLETPRYVLAGTTYPVSVRVSNLGNTSVHLTLSARSSHNLTVMLGSDTLTVPPRAGRTVQAEVVTPSDLKEKIPHTVDIAARVLEDPSLADHASSVVDIVPGSAAIEKQYVTLPVQVSLRGAGQYERGGTRTLSPQAEILGAGSFSETRTDHVSFLFRGPDLTPRSSLGLRDEYRIGYSRPGISLVAGDDNYFLTPLTELGRYGFGGGGEVRWNAVTAGGFYNETRWLSPRQREQAGFVRYNFSQADRVSLNYLGKQGIHEGNIASLRAEVNPLSRTTLDAEYGNTIADSTSDRGYAIRLTGRQPWVAYDARYVHGGPHFPGYYRDLTFTSLAANFFPLKNIRIETTVRQEDRNLNNDTLQYSAPRLRFYQVGAGYANLAMLYVRSTNQEDRLPASRYGRREDVLQLRLTHILGPLTLFGNADFGNVTDTKANLTAPFRRFAIYGTYRASARQSFGGSLEYLTDRNIFTAETQRRYSANVNAWLLIGSRTQLSVNAYGSRTITSTIQNYAVIEFSLEHVFPFGHTIALRGRHTVYSLPAAGAESAYMLSYSVPLAIPLALVRSSGEVRGRVTDAESHRGVPDALVNAGPLSSLTESDGTFAISPLKPGEYLASVDRSTIGLKRVTVQPMPFPFNITGGETTTLDFDIVRSGAVHGNVLLYEAPEPSDSTPGPYVEQGPLQNVIVEVSSDGDVQRRATDSNGRFQFTDLRPGKWKARVFSDVLPANHFFETEEQTFRLAPGGTAQLVFRVLPRKRTIQILERGELTLETPAPPRKPQVPVPPPVTAREEKTQFCLIISLGEGKGFSLQTSSWKTRAKAELVAAAHSDITNRRSQVTKAVIPGLGTRYRVTLKGFQSTQEAESACDAIARAEATASSTPSFLPEPKPSELPCLVLRGRLPDEILLQISSWKTLGKAKEVATYAEAVTGYDSDIEEAQLPDLGTRYRVRLTGFRAISDAEQTCHMLQDYLLGRAP